MSPCNHSRGGSDRQTPEAQWLAGLVKSLSFRLSEKTYLKKLKWKSRKVEVKERPVLTVDTYSCVCTQHTNKHTWTK